MQGGFLLQASLRVPGPPSKGNGVETTAQKQKADSPADVWAHEHLGVLGLPEAQSSMNAERRKMFKMSPCVGICSVVVNSVAMLQRRYKPVWINDLSGSAPALLVIPQMLCCLWHVKVCTRQRLIMTFSALR